MRKIERYRESQKGLERLSGRARGEVREGQGKRRPFRQVFALEPPRRIRIEIENSVGQTVAVFLSDGSTLYYRERGGEPVVRAASAFAVRDTLGYALQIEELVSSMLGRIDGRLPDVGAPVGRAGPLAYFTAQAGRFRVRLGFDLEGSVLRSRDYYDEEGRPVVRVFYSSFTLAGGRVVPRQLHIRDEGSGESVEVELTKVTLNPPLSPEIFFPPH